MNSTIRQVEVGTLFSGGEGVDDAAVFIDLDGLRLGSEAEGGEKGEKKEFECFHDNSV